MSFSRAVILGFIQALLFGLYVWGVALVIIGTGSWFRTQPNSVLGSIFGLTLFVVSAIISGSIVLGYPIYLALNKSFRQAVKVVIATAGWLVLLLLVIFVVLVFRA